MCIFCEMIAMGCQNFALAITHLHQMLLSRVSEIRKVCGQMLWSFEKNVQQAGQAELFKAKNCTIFVLVYVKLQFFSYFDTLLLNDLNIMKKYIFYGNIINSTMDTEY